MRPDGSDVHLVGRTTGRAKRSRDGRTVYFPNCRREEEGRGCEVYAGGVRPGVSTVVTA